MATADANGQVKLPYKMQFTIPPCLTLACAHLPPAQISFRGDGPLGSVMAIADAKGMVKGRVDNPAADPPLRSDGKLNVAEAVGLGASGVGRWCGGCGVCWGLCRHAYMCYR